VKTVLAALLLAACLSFAVAQTAPSSSAPAAPASGAAIKDPVTAAVRMILPNRQKNILAAIDAMPADKFGYKPTPDQMTFGHLVVHIIESNNGMCAKAADVPAPKTEEVKDTDPKDKLAAAAKASFDFCADAVSKMSDAKLGDNITIFGSTQGPRSMAVFFMAGGWADHYGAAAMYLRLNNIVPPSAQPKK
jgi:uncharacterized damage-inducible protein DinB